MCTGYGVLCSDCTLCQCGAATFSGRVRRDTPPFIPIAGVEISFVGREWQVEMTTDTEGERSLIIGAQSVQLLE